ncbi:hypothetical protein GC169_05540 [bacterium]|nr:hypothetical protein [bacterium]
MTKILDIGILVVFALASLFVWFIPSVSNSSALKNISEAAKERKAEREAEAAAAEAQARREREEGPVFVTIEPLESN